MSLIRLTIDRISYSQNTNGAYALLLSEKDGERKLPVVIGAFEAQSIAVALEKEIKPPRPLTHDLFKNFSDCFEIKIKQVIIHKIIDAIALAIRFNSPIFTYENVLEKAGIILKHGGEKLQKESDKSTTVDVNKMSIKQIKNAIEIAVKNEDYELAAELRDKLTKKNE
jgi:bifunctional DNase/RNase